MSMLVPACTVIDSAFAARLAVDPCRNFVPFKPSICMCRAARTCVSWFKVSMQCCLYHGLYIT